MHMGLYLRGFCIKNDWAASAFAGFGAVLFIATLWAVSEFYALINAWVMQDVLFNGLLFAAATLADLLLIFGFLRLGFSECSDTDKDRNCQHAYRGRRSALFPELAHWVESLGKNPRRRSRRS